MIGRPAGPFNCGTALGYDGRERKEGAMKGILVGVAAGLVLGGCASMGGGSAQSAKSAKANLVNAQGAAAGTATLAEQPDGTVMLVVEARGLAPGRHGIHIHAVGRCDPPAFTTAGGHYNPLGRKHGLENPEGAHGGDLPNLEADASGTARYQARTDRVTLRDGLLSVFDGDGSALVIHEKADDQRTDPTGDSGGRVACGVIVPG
jgi:Cu-Zn family superoxide dismutase